MFKNSKLIELNNSIESGLEKIDNINKKLSFYSNELNSIISENEKLISDCNDSKVLAVVQYNFSIAEQIEKEVIKLKEEYNKTNNEVTSNIELVKQLIMEV